MAYLHNFQKQGGIVLQQIGQKVKQTAQIAGDLKFLYDTGMFIRNAMTAASPALALL